MIKPNHPPSIWGDEERPSFSKPYRESNRDQPPQPVIIEGESRRCPGCRGIINAKQSTSCPNCEQHFEPAGHVTDADLNKAGVRK